jgi:hypothetical protein
VGGWMDGWLGGWVGGWMGGWMDGFCFENIELRAFNAVR